MKLFIANLTNQVYDFVYRLPEVKNAQRTTIDIGKQFEVPYNLNQIQINEIIEQNRVYGMIDAKSIDQARKFVGLCYSIGEEVKFQTIIRGSEHNHHVLVRRGQENRQAAAIVADQTMQKLAGEAGIGLGATTTTIQQDVKEGQKPDVNDGFVVSSRPGESPSPTPAARKRDRKRATG